jgi:hypothetical protein
MPKGALTMRLPCSPLALVAFVSLLCPTKTLQPKENMGLFTSGCANDGAHELKPRRRFPPYSGRILDTDAVDALPAGQWPDALQRLFEESKSSAKVPIRFTMQAFTGYGFVLRASEGYVIGIRIDLSHEDQESDIAHELFHIILQQKGFSSQVDVPNGASGYLAELGFTITSCVDDAIIDDRTSALGFHPERLNRKRFEQFQAPADVYAKLRDPIYADGTALLIACDSFRKGNGNELSKRWASVNEDVTKHADELRKKIGDVRCDGAPACNEKKKQIRDILHYPILLCNPLTGKWE